MIRIPLTRGLEAVIDDADSRLTRFKWCAQESKTTPNKFYAVRDETVKGIRIRIFLHREVLGIKEATGVDHKNGDSLDCRRDNLRPATVIENGRNRGPQANNSSGYKGVSYRHDKRLKKPSKRPWRANIKVNGKHRHIGDYTTAIDAAKAYDAAAKLNFGEFAWLNFR